MKSVKQIVILFCLVHACLSQVLSKGVCNQQLPTVKNFDANRYLGRWYEQQKYPFIFELGGKCIYAQYGLLQNGDISVYNFNINELTGAPKDIRGSAKIVGPAKLLVTFDNMPAFAGGANYWVLDTDYENYAVVYSCTDILGFLKGQVVWILTRERDPKPQYIEQARELIKQLGLSLGPLQRTNQNGCGSSN
ncbi:apolipoprotein D-like [Stomoxys calcitrans]|uniref:apolipoprotein D-like n=1 Tax=Stomoxys calcitrans TaxID=35570 RepID=UPI0027E313BC|nr:apolipoprotein D-like [Stomoxys calcitrans]